MNKYKANAAASAIYAATLLSNGVNGEATITGKMFVDKMVFSEHPYLQNEFFKEVILRFIGVTANLKDKQYDPRNAPMVKTCKYIAEKLFQAWDKEHRCVLEPPVIDDEKLQSELHDLWKINQDVERLKLPFTIQLYDYDD